MYMNVHVISLQYICCSSLCRNLLSKSGVCEVGVLLRHPLLCNLGQLGEDRRKN